MIGYIGEFLSSYGNIIDLCLLNSFIAFGVWLSLRANMFTLGTGGFMALGAYCSVYLTMQLGMPFSIAVLGGGGLAAVAAIAIGAPVLRLRGDYFMLATFAFTEVVRVIALNWESMTGGAIGIIAIPKKTETWQLAVLVLIALYVAYALRSSYFGRAIDGFRLDEVMSQSVGINVFSFKMSMFVTSGFVAGVGGAMAAHLNYFIGPTDFSLLRSVDALAYPILGGVNSIVGPILGATLTTILPEILRFSSQWREIILGLLILAVVLYLPGGAASLFRRDYLDKLVFRKKHDVLSESRSR